MHPLLPVSLGSIFLKQQQQQQQFACLGQRVRGNHDDDDGEKHKNGVLPGNLSPFFWYQRRGGGIFRGGGGHLRTCGFWWVYLSIWATRLAPGTLPLLGPSSPSRAEPAAIDRDLIITMCQPCLCSEARKEGSGNGGGGGKKNAMYERHRAASNNDYDDDDGQGTKCIRSVACAYRDVGWNLISKFFPWSFNLKSSIVVKDLINLLFSITEKIWQWNKKYIKWKSNSVLAYSSLKVNSWPLLSGFNVTKLFF